MEDTLITLKAAAKFLKLSEKIVQEMVNSGIFTVATKGKIIKLSKNQIDSWLTNLSDKEVQILAMKRTKTRFQDYFRPENILLDFEADNKYEAIGEMSKFAKELKIVQDHRWLYEVVVTREELVSTAVGKQTAFLHPRHVHPSKIKIPSLLFGICNEGVDFDAPDKKPVKYFFLLLFQDDKQHLFTLSYLSRLLNNKATLKKLKEAKTRNDYFEIISSI
jgi:mannitol/fructose-specific phosphotransferase system IIA component (Ntr-type)